MTDQPMNVVTHGDLESIDVSGVSRRTAAEIVRAFGIPEHINAVRGYSDGSYAVVLPVSRWTTAGDLDGSPFTVVDLTMAQTQNELLVTLYRDL